MNFFHNERKMKILLDKTLNCLSFSSVSIPSTSITFSYFKKQHFACDSCHITSIFVTLCMCMCVCNCCREKPEKGVD